MKLEDVLWTTVLWVCVIFFAFAAGVWYDENVLHKEQEPVPIPEVEEIQTAIIEPVEPVMAAMPIPATEAAPAGLDPMIEDTFLRDDIPLSYELQSALYGACLEFGIGYELALAVIEQETNFRNVTGDGGDSVGYMQIQKRWWGELMAEIGADDLSDPKDNFRTGCAILRQLFDKYDTAEDALSAYNTGKPGQTRYGREVLEKMEKYYG